VAEACVMNMNECCYEQSHDGRKRALAERVKVRARPERRRRWSAAAKLAIVRTTLAAGSTSQGVAERHGIGTGLIYPWRKQLLRAAMAGFATVEIKLDVPAALPGPVQGTVARPLSSPPSLAPALASSRAMPGGIEVELPSGVRLRFGSDVDGPALQRILVVALYPLARQGILQCQPPARDCLREHLQDSRDKRLIGCTKPETLDRARLQAGSWPKAMSPPGK